MRAGRASLRAVVTVLPLLCVVACGSSDGEPVRGTGTYQDALRAYQMGSFAEAHAIASSLDAPPDGRLLETLSAMAAGSGGSVGALVASMEGPVEVGELDLAVPVRGYDEAFWQDQTMGAYLTVLERCLSGDPAAVPTRTAMEVRDSLATVLTHPFVERLSAATVDRARTLSDRATTVLMERTPLGNYSSEVE